MIDMKAICDALATRYTAAAIATPTGATALRPSFGQMPESAPAIPCIYIEPTTGTVVASVGIWDHHLFLDAVFLISKRTGTTRRPEKERQLWLGSLLAATEAQMKLGLGAASGYVVKSAFPQGWAWDEVDVADQAFHAIRIHYDVWAQETVSLTP